MEHRKIMKFFQKPEIPAARVISEVKPQKENEAITKLQLLLNYEKC